MSATEQILAVLEDTALQLQKAQTNLKKCPKVRLTRGYVESRIQSIDDYWNIFKKYHEQLVKCVPKEKKTDISYFVNEDYFVYEDLYLCIKADLKDILNSYEKPTSVSSTPTAGITHGDNQGLLKLPRIQLPLFSGVYEEFPAYQDFFVSLVHNNTSLSNVQRLHYLKSSLCGEAEALLRHIQVTEGNYEQSWSMLKTRYGNKRLIVNSLLKRLFTQRKITSQTAGNIKSLLDTTTECINSLKNLKLASDSWDPLIIFLVVQKLDPDTHRDWEQCTYREDNETLPTWDELSKFLHSKFRTLELINPSSREKPTRTREYAVHISTTTNKQSLKPRSCWMCKEAHTLCHCKEFTKMQPTERCEYIKKNNLCFNCLAPGHSASKCRLTLSCRLCRKRHHTLIHQSMPVTSSNQPDNKQVHYSEVESSQGSADQTNVDFSSHFTASTPTALLATAMVPVRNDSGHTTVLRALIDNGSQATFISERAAQMLRLKRRPIDGTITGVGSTKTKIKHAAEIQLLSRHDASFNTKIKVYVMATQLTNKLPSRSIASRTWPHLQGLILADPSYNLPGPIDMLLGVDVCAQIMKSEFIKGPPGTPCAENTCLGWILYGPVHDFNQREDVIAMLHNVDLDDMLKKRWELDKDERKKPTKEELKCEEIFKATTTRTNDERYVVKLPTKTDILLSPHGETRNIALKRLYQLEKRLDRNETLKEEFKDLNHMEEVQPKEVNNPAVYLTHHTVVREEKEMSKKDTYEDDIQHLKRNKTIRKHSKLKTLQPYLDEEGILRVGGRLRHSNLTEDSKHPIILDHDNDLSALIVAEAHRKTLHGGCQLMLGYLRTKFWILKAKKLVKAEMRKCMICTRLRAAARNQIMGDLPKMMACSYLSAAGAKPESSTAGCWTPPYPLPEAEVPQALPPFLRPPSTMAPSTVTSNVGMTTAGAAQGVPQPSGSSSSIGVPPTMPPTEPALDLTTSLKSRNPRIDESE